MKVAIGIDYSMTCPAACAYSPEHVQFWFAHETKWDVTLADVSTEKTADTKSTTRRGWYHASCFVGWLLNRFPNVQHVAIEDYAYAATGRVFHIGEHTGILKHALDNNLIDYHPVPPTVVKKFATGKGNADKPKMTAAFLVAYPAAQTWIPQLFPRARNGFFPAKSPLADLADAYWIARHAFEAGLTAEA
jgi:hypothetical protein